MGCMQAAAAAAARAVHCHWAALLPRAPAAAAHAAVAPTLADALLYDPQPQVSIRALLKRALPTASQGAAGMCLLRMVAMGQYLCSCTGTGTPLPWQCVPEAWSWQERAVLLQAPGLLSPALFKACPPRPDFAVEIAPSGGTRNRRSALLRCLRLLFSEQSTHCSAAGNLTCLGVEFQVRAAAAVAIGALLESPASRAYLGIAEVRPAARQPARWEFSTFINDFVKSTPRSMQPLCSALSMCGICGCILEIVRVSGCFWGCVAWLPSAGAAAGRSKPNAGPEASPSSAPTDQCPTGVYSRTAVRPVLTQSGSRRA